MVSGASNGIGPAVAEALAAEGVRLSLCARSAGPLGAAAAEPEATHGVSCLACPADLSRGEDIQAWVRATGERFGGVDVLVNNAGAAQGGPFLTLPDQAWLDSWQLKLFGSIRVAGVNPGPIRTDRWDGMLARWGAARGVSAQEAEREILRGVPRRRPGRPQEVASVFVFLASDLASYITGAPWRWTVA
jgi:NAD(P)-dependent dehydrogenase (short-subunit alcohol dehydrogenase family)